MKSNQNLRQFALCFIFAFFSLHSAFAADAGGNSIGPSDKANPCLVAMKSVQEITDKLQVSPELQAQIAELEARVRRELTEAEKAALDLISLNKKIKKIETQLSWAEKKLWGSLASFFGGDKEKILAYKEKNKQKEELEKILEKEKSEHRDADKVVLDTIDVWLKTNSEHYQRLASLQQLLTSAVCDGEKCLREINEALQAVSDAETAEMGDAISDNKPISIVSNMANSDAADEVDDVSPQVRKFIQSLNAIQLATPQHDDISRVPDDFIDTVFDMRFSFNIDFLSVVNWIELGNAKADLQKIKHKIELALAQVQSEHNKMAQIISEILCQTRQLCAIPVLRIE